MYKKVWMALLLTALVGPLAFAEGVAEDPVVIKGSASVDLTSAEITRISPLVVLPGTLVGVEGSGFGTKAGVVKIGNLTITDFLGWEDGAVFFRIPSEGLTGPSELQLGTAYSEDVLTPAPAGSITIRWTVDLPKLNAVVAKDWKGVYNAPALPKFDPPLYVKGEWVKSGEIYGYSAIGSWDGGSRVRMLKDKSGTKWFAEIVLNPSSIESYGNKVMKFAFEDNNVDNRDLSAYESDYTFILKKDWAKTDQFPTINSDPGVTPSPKDKLFDAKTNTINSVYPVAK